MNIRFHRCSPGKKVEREGLSQPVGYLGHFGFFFRNLPPIDIPGGHQETSHRRCLQFGITFGSFREIGISIMWHEEPEHTFSEIQKDRIQRGFY